jgi:hypothetical protein
MFLEVFPIGTSRVDRANIRPSEAGKSPGLPLQAVGQPSR